MTLRQVAAQCAARHTYQNDVRCATVTRSDVSNTYTYTVTFVDPATPTTMSTDYPYPIVVA